MAKKKAAPKVQPAVQEEDTSAGFLNITLNSDGTYDIDTVIDPSSVLLYANMLADMNEGKIANTILTQFAQSKSKNEQTLALYIAAYFKKLSQLEKPVIAPNRIFRHKGKK